MPVYCIGMDDNKLLRFENATTVEPLLSGPPLSGHPLLNGHISKSRNFCNTNTINYPSIKRPPLLSGRGHPKSGPKCCFMSIFTSIKRPACSIYLAQHHVKRSENKSRATILAINRRTTINFYAFLRPLPPIQCCRFVYIYDLTYCADKIGYVY